MSQNGHPSSTERHDLHADERTRVKALKRAVAEERDNHRGGVARVVAIAAQLDEAAHDPGCDRSASALRMWAHELRAAVGSA